MSLESVQDSVANISGHVVIFDEMQREDFLALAAALRQFNVYQPLATLQEPASRFGREPCLAMVMD